MPVHLKIEEWDLLDKLVEVILKNVEGCVVEIGLGTSTVILNKYAVQNNKKHYCCDISMTKCKFARKLLNTIVFEMSSEEFLTKFDDSPIAIAFLDGSHKFDIVKKEADFLLPRMSKYGVLFLHDTFIPEKRSSISEVFKLRQLLENDSSFQVFTFPFTAAQYGLTMVMKRLECYR